MINPGVNGSGYEMYAASSEYPKLIYPFETPDGLCDYIRETITQATNKTFFAQIQKKSAFGEEMIKMILKDNEHLVNFEVLKLAVRYHKPILNHYIDRVTTDELEYLLLL